MTGSVCAVVVTHNRKRLLSECLAAVGAQTRLPDHILVVDNASTDGTEEMLAHEGWLASDRLGFRRLSHNWGGAGGFHAGMRAAYEQGFEWLWLMDDDTIPTLSALESLLTPLKSTELPRPSILASKVVWSDGGLHPKNLPWPRTDEAHRETLVSAAGHGLLLIRAATFVSIAVHRSAVSAHGLPHAHYFIWGDDGEFTARVLRRGVGYLVPDSLVHHKTDHKHSVFRSTGQYYYELRNKIFMLRSDSWDRREKIGLVVASLLGLGSFLGHNRLAPRSLVTVVRALRDGLVQDPAHSDPLLAADLAGER